MSKIKIHSDRSSTFTNVPNEFIDQYMPHANGEFIKIYLYLLRYINISADAISISKMADQFEHTEKDILRALKYWEKVKLLRLEYDTTGELSGICLLPLSGSASNHSAAITPVAAQPVLTPASDSVPATPAAKPADIHTYSRDEITNFKKQDEVRELIFVSETYLGRTLNATDIQTILHLYDQLHLSADVIEYLIEYCVIKGHTSIRYIEKTGLAWHEAGIKTVSDAKEQNQLRSSSHTAVMKAFGIKSRNLVKPERELIEKWSSSFGFNTDIISEACTRTISTIHQPSFEYADKILENWHKNQVHGLADISTLDEHHKSKAAGSNALPRTRTTSSNKFNNFEQRSYDYSQLERQLVHSSDK